MQTILKTVQEFLNMDQRFLIPLFQRGYAWTAENQWDLLWDDVQLLTDQVLNGEMSPHFLGAVVVQNSGQGGPGEMPTWSVVDGQQRLTTIQLMSDAAAAVMTEYGLQKPANRLLKISQNDEDFWTRPEDRFKLLPTNKDRAAFREVMAAEPPVDYDALKHAKHRVQLAHRYFATRTRRFLQSNESSMETNAEALAVAITAGLQIVAITLEASENAQEIFETLNARMTPLEPTDLIKNYLFQKLLSEGYDLESTYVDLWQPYETVFWEEKLVLGRIERQRLSVFFGYWLEMMTLEEIPAKDLFREFKKFSEQRWQGTTHELLKELAISAESFESISNSVAGTGSIEGVDLIVYRFLAMDLSIVWPVVLWLLRHSDDSESGRSDAAEALRALESWMVRRVLAGGRSQNYAQTILRLLIRLGHAEPGTSVQTVTDFLRGESAQTSYWPSDSEVRNAVRVTAVYKALTQARVRVLLEALEDDARGFTSPTPTRASSRIERRILQVEHVMPQEWQENWTLPEGQSIEERDLQVQMIGNLSLLPAKFNGHVSNKDWETKRAKFKAHSTILLNAQIAESDEWSDADIESRTALLAERILAIWPAPSDLPERRATTLVSAEQAQLASITIVDLLEAQIVLPGEELIWHRVSRDDEYRVQVTDEGLLEAKDGTVFKTPSEAASRLTGSNYNGWITWTLLRTGQTLDEKRIELVQLMQIPSDSN